MRQSNEIRKGEDLKTKILYLHASAELYGADYVLLELIKRLDRFKYEPIVFLPFDGPLCAKLRAAGATVEVVDLAVLRRKNFNSRGVVAYTLCFFRSIAWLQRFIRKEDIGLVHTNTSAVWDGAVAAKLTRRPHVWQVMEIIVSPRFLWKVSALLVGTLSNRVSTISNAVRDHLIRGYAGNADKAVTVYHGVDSTIYNPVVDSTPVRDEFGLADNVPVVGMAARIKPWKGQECFLRAAAKVLQEMPETRFFVVGDVFAGEDHYREQMLALIDELGIREHVFVAGFRTDLPQVIAAFDVFVLPSTLPEPNATVLLAAMAMAKPVVATAIGGTLETVVDGKTGILVPPGETDLMARAILELLRDPKKRRQYGDAGRHRQEDMFSISAYADQIQGFYDEILAEESRDRK